MANWYYAVGSATEGPVSEDELRAMAHRGDLTPTSYVVPEGESSWVALGEVEARLGLTRSPWGSYADPPAGVGTPDPIGTPPLVSDVAPTPQAPTPDPAASGWATPEPTAPAADTGWSAPPGGGPAAAPTAWGGPPADASQQGWGAPPAQEGWGAPPAQPGWGAPPQPGPQPGGWGAPQGDPNQQQGWGAAPAPAPGWSSDYTAYGSPYNVGGGGPGGAAYAEWWQRLLAKIIDFFVLLVPAVLIFFVLAWDDLQEQLDNNDGGSFNVTVGTGASLSASIIIGVIGFAYYAYFNGRGQTLGKAALGIKVVRADGQGAIGPAKGLMRHGIQFLQFVPLVSCLVYIFGLVDALWPLWDDRKQSLHDKIAGSVVVKSR